MRSKYQRVRKLGEGTYGTVYQARCLESGRTVALKKIKLDEQFDGIPNTAMREITILKELDHVNVVKLLDVEYSAAQRKLYLIFEYVEEDLAKHIKKKRLSALQVKSYGLQILKGLEYLHKSRVMHRDLKPQNILVTREGVIKLADFGLAREFLLPIPTMSKEIETLWYRSPELLLGCARYDQSIDLWTVGCVIYQIAQGQPMFQCDSEVQMLHKIFAAFGTPDHSTWWQLVEYQHYRTNFPRFRAQGLHFSKLEEEGRDLVLRLCVPNPAFRLGVKSALNHPFFEQIHLPLY